MVYFQQHRLSKNQTESCPQENTSNIFAYILIIFSLFSLYTDFGYSNQSILLIFLKVTPNALIASRKWPKVYKFQFNMFKKLTFNDVCVENKLTLKKKVQVRSH